MEVDEATVIAATEATVVTAVIVIVARATATEVEVAMAVAATVHRMALLTLLLLLLAPQIPTLLTTTLNMPSGPLTTQPTQPKTHMLPTAVSRQLWPSIRRATDSITAKVTPPDRRSLLHLALELLHHHHLPQNLQAMELHHRPHHHLLDRQESAAMVQCLLRQACKCFAALSLHHSVQISENIIQPFELRYECADYWFARRSRIAPTIVRSA